MLEQVVRSYYQYWLVDDVASLIGKKMTPIQLTLIGGLIGISVALALFFHAAIFAVGLLLLSGYIDTLDGTVARQTQQCSALGTVLDILMDRCVEFAVILGLLFANPSNALMCLLMLGAILLCVTSFLVVGIFTPNQSSKSFHYSSGIMERPEAFILFIALIVFPAYFTLLSGLFFFLVMLTMLIRVYQFSKTA